MELVRHTLVYGSGYISMAAVGLVLVPVYAYHLSPAEFGLLALMLVLYGLMKQVYDLGLMNSVGRFFFDLKPQGEAALRRMRLTALLFLAVYGGVLTGGLCLFADDVSRVLTGEAQHADLVRIVAALLYAEALAIVPLTLIRMEERSTLFVLITLARMATTLVLSIVFVAYLDLGVRGALLGNAIPAVAVLFLLVSHYRVALGGRFSSKLLRTMLAFGLPFFPVLLSTWLIDASDRYLLELFTSREEVGEYSLAYRIGQVMQIAVAAFAMGWAPLRYKIYERADAAALYRRLTSLYVVAAGILVVALAVFAREIVAVISPPSYAPAADVVPLLVLAYALYGLYLIMVTGMGVSKRTVPMAWIAGAGAAVNVGLNIVLIPVWGMHAAAATTVLANAIMVAGAWFYSQRAYPIAYDWARIGRVAVIGGLTAGGAALVSPPGHLAGIGWALLALVIFLAALVTTGTIERGDLLAARLWTRRALPVLRGRFARSEMVE